MTATTTITTTQRGQRRALAPLATVTLTVLVALGGALGRPAAAQDATPSPATAPGVIGDAAEIDCETGALATAAAGAGSTLTIVSEESEARYRAHEELANIGAAEAVGRTNAFIGQILFDDAGNPLPCSRFDIDLRTLQSDEARRDNYLYGNILETEQFPLATFILTAVEGLDGPLPDGEETTFTLIGNLTIHGLTKLVAWEATVTRQGDALAGAATTEFDMPDFAIEEPVVGPVVSVNETIVLETDITAEVAG